MPYNRRADTQSFRAPSPASPYITYKSVVPMPMSPRLLRPRQAGGFDPRTISGLGFWYDASDTKTLFTTSLGSVSAVSSPTDIPNCAGWWDASDASTLFDATSGGSQVSNGGAVARWNDKSGLGRHATQATSANRPTYSASAAGGKGAVSWGASTNSRSLAWASGSNNTVLREVFVVCSYDRGTTFGGFEGLIGGTANDNANIGLIGNGSGTAAFYTASNFSIWDNLIINGANGGAYSNIVPAGGISGWPALPSLNGLSVLHAFGAADQSSNGICIGSDRSIADRGWMGNICEVVAYSAPLTDTQRVQVQKYLAAKWPTAFVDNYTAATLPSDPVGAWLDKSGNGRTLTQATAALRPVVGTVSQRSAVDWGTGTNVKHLANSTSGNWREVAVVLDYDGPNPFGGLFSALSGNANVAGLMTFTNTSWLTLAQGSGYTNFNTNGTETVTALPAILSPSVVQAWRTADTPAFDGIRVGTDRNQAGRGWLGKICEIMAWTRELTAAERTAIRRGLAAKWKVTL